MLTNKVSNTIQRILEIVSAIFFIAIIVVVVLNVILRSFFNLPIAGTYELVQISACVFGAAAVAICALQDGHVCVDIITSKLPQNPRGALLYFAHIIDLLYYGVICFCVAKIGMEKILTGETSDTLLVPLAPFRLWVAFCFLCGVIIKIVKIIKVKDVLPTLQSNREKELEELDPDKLRETDV